jgi:murein DD-endopeptidase MepM/ murein hydrolase activator NlpD
MPLQKLSAGLAAVFLFAFGVAVAFADTPPTTTTGTTTEPPTTTDAPTTTAPPTTTTEATTTATTATTTAATASTTITTATTAPETTTTATRTTKPAPATTAATTKAKATPARAATPPRACPLRAAAILRPNRAPVVLRAGAGHRGLAYRGSLLTASAVTCTASGRRRAEVVLRSLSLFGGEVAATRVTLELGKAGTTAGLVADGKHVSGSLGTRFPLGKLGYLVAGSADSGLTVHLVRRHRGLPAGTVILVAVARVPSRPVAAPTRKHVKRKKHLAAREPLTVTPQLGQRRFVFPVAGPADYVDTYGAFRGDVPGNWHHGDDIFAPLGTPVVAVASGTVNRVGWQRLGGWRLWVRDSVGDQFYYAHLSGYAPAVLRSNRVEAGQVIGFIGNTGDAFTTPPHLHFEVHPRPFLHLGYDGAVNPTTYLNRWRRLHYENAPRPVHPPLPKQPLLRREARFVFRELLAARHLITRAPKATERPHVPLPAGSSEPVHAQSGLLREAAPATTARAGSSSPTLALLGALASTAVVAMAGLQPALRRWRTGSAG